MMPRIVPASTDFFQREVVPPEQRPEACKACVFYSPFPHGDGTVGQCDLRSDDLRVLANQKPCADGKRKEKVRRGGM